MATALGDIISKGIKVSLVDINKSNYGFEPDVENNEILFGMKALNNVGKPVIEEILKQRPFVSFKDFLQRCNVNKTAIISLIKAGAFDKLSKEKAKKLNIEPRIFNMIYYISLVCEPKKKINLQNLNGLIQKKLIPQELNFYTIIYYLNKALKITNFYDYETKQNYYLLNDTYLQVYLKCNFSSELLDYQNDFAKIEKKDWDNLYSKQMDNVRDWMKENQNYILNRYNSCLFLESWNKYAKGTLSAWEMESMCFYYHKHELADVDIKKYDIVDFSQLPEEPEVDYYFKRNGKEIPIYKTFKIIGTVLGKKDNKSSISILTTTGVVNVKFTKEYFAMFNRQISEKQEDGTKKVMEKGWFQRGTKVMCTGFRRGDTFQTKNYKHTPTHQLYKITNINEDGTIGLNHNRYGQGGNE